MSKKLLAMLIMLFSSDALAEWTYINSTDNFDAYVDLMTIRKHGNEAKIWSLMDHKNIQSIGTKKFLSVKVQFKYDCENETSRILFMSFSSGNMGSGDATHSVNQADSETPIIPNSIDEQRSKIACGKK